MQNLIYFFMAVGLSMDAFSLAIAYGTNPIKKERIIILGALVGLFHYIMPSLGSIIGSYISLIVTKSNYIVSLVFFILAYEMYKSRNEEHSSPLSSILALVIFAFTVSIDSFSVGIALGMEKANLKLAFLIFSLTSAAFTYTGLLLGKKLSQRYGHKAIIFGIIILLFLAIRYLFN